MCTNFKPAALVPIFNHPTTIEVVTLSLLTRGLDVIIVDDGSNEETKQILARVSELSHKGKKVYLLERKENGGKGAAVISGFEFGFNLGYTHLLQIDADGQHDASKISKMIELARKYPGELILGKPKYDETAPWSRKFGRKLTNFWVAINTLSFNPPDAMCGFRVYPLELTLKALSGANPGLRMDFDPEILVRLMWLGIKIKTLEVKVSYPLDGISHFQAFADNLAISKMHTKLFFGMLIRIPSIIFNKISR